MKPSAAPAFIAIAALVWHLEAKPPAPGKDDNAAAAVRTVMNAENVLRDIPLRDVIHAATGHRIIAMNPDKSAADAECRNRIVTAADTVLAFLNAAGSPARGLRRINEASRFVENKLVELLDGEDFTCTRPRTSAGTDQRSGYPDLRILHKPTGRVYYLDPKLFESASVQSTLRSFYYEPKDLTGKIHEDACHLLLGISHDGNDGAWRFTGWRLLDLHDFRVRLKAEFQASNKDLYRRQLTIGESAK